MVIAIDFDGTIVEDRYPEIGEPKIFAFETLNEMIKARHQLILWTRREGQLLEDAVEFCRENGIEFYSVNHSYPGEDFNEDDGSRKLNCELFISQKNVGGLPGWGEVWQEIKRMEDPNGIYGNEDAKPQSSGFWGLVKNLMGK
ncbi:hydrolase [bacterium SCSIO 12741]|nr:hydrolase [bacterium SCSIO 12741]